MLDADAPAVVGDRTAANNHVTAGVDAVVAQARFVEDRRRAVDRPALHEAGWIEHRLGDGPCVEVPVRLMAQLLAPVEHLAHIRARVFEREVAAVDAADLAVVLVGAERGVDVAQPVEQAVESRVVDVRVADVDDDGHPHHVLDAVHCYFQDLAARIADCSDCANASLEFVAPETA